MTDERRDWLKIARAPGLHAGRLGSVAVPPGALVHESAAALQALGLPQAAIAALRAPNPADLDLDEQWLDEPNRSLVTWGSPLYPPLLATIADAPLVLYAEGDVGALT